MLYVDSSALVKRYVAEPSSDLAESLLQADPDWVTAQHTFVEVSLALSRRLDESDTAAWQRSLEADWRRLVVVPIDDQVARAAARIGSEAGIRTLDAIHLAAAERVASRAIPIVTFDQRLADAARDIGFNVVGI